MNRFLADLEREGFIAIIRSTEPATAVTAALELVAAGVRLLEISLTTPGALHAIAEVRSRVDTTVELGAGTVMDARDARAAIAAGASFLVSPHVAAAVARVADESDVAYLPGAMTPTEIVIAATFTDRFVKLFPAGSLGPTYVEEIHAPLPDVKLVATGGITAENAESFMTAGAAAVAVGSMLTGLVGSGEEAVSRAVRDLRAAIQRGRQVHGA